MLTWGYYIRWDVPRQARIPGVGSGALLIREKAGVRFPLRASIVEVLLGSEVSREL